MAVFIEKPPVTSSNCYKTMKNASKLPVTMAKGGRLKTANYHYFALVCFVSFFIKYDKQDHQGKAAFNERSPHPTQ
jgi:hypothetical protein